jgi:hypothetical protein
VHFLLGAFEEASGAVLPPPGVYAHMQPADSCCLIRLPHCLHFPLGVFEEASGAVLPPPGLHMRAARSSESLPTQAARLVQNMGVQHGGALLRAALPQSVCRCHCAGTSPHVIACTLKRFLLTLPEPLLTYKCARPPLTVMHSWLLFSLVHLPIACKAQINCVVPSPAAPPLLPASACTAAHARACIAGHARLDFYFKILLLT